MRGLILALAAVVALAVGGGALAQSQQGGYLGKNPGTNQTASTSPPSGISGSHQGGYLGLNPGATLKPLSPAQEEAAEASVSPRAWCKSSTEPSRCWAVAERDHASCMSTSPDHYDACRFALDKMHN
jgi:hypothetical protein